ncbi:MAG: type II toxin-antitoxin system prevent-host-death family antitoxin [Egibacteraceae bacterium]
MSDVAIPLTDDREELAAILDRVSRHERLVLIRGGERVAAVIPAEDLEFLEELEDLHDLQEARRALAEDDGERVAWSDLEEELGL